jgi:UDP-2,3-diacylglucosamine hydrolase
MSIRDKSGHNSVASDLSCSPLSTDKPSADNSNSDCVIFISDLHLCASRPHITAAFLDFLQHTASKAQSLYILGDLFEYWAGDDDIEDSFHQQVISAFHTATENGLCIYLMHGNRDFLISQNFCLSTKICLIKDPSLIRLYGKKALLSHGDHLCTDDIMYQTFRKQVRDENWQKAFLNQPLAERKKQIESIRNRSEQDKSQKSVEIMDVNQEAVNAMLEMFDYPELLIHGHTHRPQQHLINLAGHQITRWVLGDWYEQGSYLICNQQDCHDVQL